MFTTRRHLNLMNINLNDLIIPKDLEGNSIDMKLLQDKSYLICISYLIMSKKQLQYIQIFLQKKKMLWMLKQ